MSYSTNTLQWLRDVTKPIHRDIDSAGIGSSMRSGTFDENVYCKWLKSNHQFSVSVKNTFSNHPDSSWCKYLPNNFHENLLLEDMNNLGNDCTAISTLITAISHEDELLTIAYSYLGSMIGMEMILKYLEKNNSDYPLAFLTAKKEESGKFGDFMADLRFTQLTISEEKLRDFTIRYWMWLRLIFR